MYWTLQDFAAVPGWAGGNPRGNPPFVQKGLVDLQGNLKPAFAIVVERSTTPPRRSQALEPPVDTARSA